MISKWADYVITGVRYDHGVYSQGTKVAAVEVRMDLGGRLGGAEIWTRQHVLEAIYQDHETFATALPASGDDWRRGAHLQVVRVHGMDYLRVDRAEIPCDDLGRTVGF